MRKVGIVVGSDKVILVDVDMSNSTSITVLGDHSWPLQTGNRPRAYEIMRQQIVNYLTEKKIEQVVIKASAVNRRGTTKAHLQAAELRGVALAAAASVAETLEVAKASISRSSSRKADEYLVDDTFWTSAIVDGKLRIGSREAALLLIKVDD